MMVAGYWGSLWSVEQDPLVQKHIHGVGDRPLVWPGAGTSSAAHPVSQRRLVLS